MGQIFSSMMLREGHIYTIYKEYVVPFVDAIKRAGLPFFSTIQEIIGLWQKAAVETLLSKDWHEKLPTEYLAMLNDSSLCSIIGANRELQSAYLKLAAFYFAPLVARSLPAADMLTLSDFVQSEYIGYREAVPLATLDAAQFGSEEEEPLCTLDELLSAEETRPLERYQHNPDVASNDTTIRALLFAVLAPMPEFDDVGFQVAKRSIFQLKAPGAIVASPLATSSTAASDAGIAGVYYVIGNKIKITRPRGLFDASVGVRLRSAISDTELRHATQLPDNTPVKLFPSFFDALEYSQAHIDGGCIPIVMQVYYLGNNQTLAFKGECLYINRGVKSSIYSSCHRRTMVSYADGLSQDIAPIKAISVYEQGAFANYHVLNECLDLNIEAPKFKKIANPRTLAEAYRNLDHAFLAVNNKVSSLGNRGFAADRQLLVNFLAELHQQFEQLNQEVTLCTDSVSAKQQALDTFTRNCNDIFTRAMTSNLKEHRGYKHILVEVLYSILTLGFYLSLMIRNKIKNDRFTLFATDTVNTLQATQMDLQLCTALISQSFAQPS